MLDYKLLPLFSYPVYLKILNLDFKKIIDLIPKDFESSNYSSNDNLDNISLCSGKSYNVLNEKKSLFLKEIITKEFNLFSKDVLKLKNKFEITTSWFTKTLKNQYSNYHCHKNCLYSGVLYLNTDEKSGDISFINNKNDDNFELIPEEFNVYNSNEYFIKPKDGLILFFPSRLYHRINKNQSDMIRYSLAFNFMPIGSFGHSDSYINVNFKNDK